MQQKATIFAIGFTIVAIIGWVMNIVSLVSAGSISSFGGMEIARAIGVVVAPLGAVLGYF